MVESQPSKLLVASSILVSRSKTPQMTAFYRIGLKELSLLIGLDLLDHRPQIAAHE